MKKTYCVAENRSRKWAVYFLGEGAGDFLGEAAADAGDLAAAAGAAAGESLLGDLGADVSTLRLLSAAAVVAGFFDGDANGDFGCSFSSFLLSLVQYGLLCTNTASSAVSLWLSIVC